MKDQRSYVFFYTYVVNENTFDAKLRCEMLHELKSLHGYDGTGADMFRHYTRLKALNFTNEEIENKMNISIHDMDKDSRTVISMELRQRFSNNCEGPFLVTTPSDWELSFEALDSILKAKKEDGTLSEFLKGASLN